MLIKFLQENRDIIAWKPSDMPRVPRELIEHTLNVDPNSKPIKQKLRRFSQDKKDVIRKEVTRLLDAGFIREVDHPFPRRINTGGCVLIILISIVYA